MHHSRLSTLRRRFLHSGLRLKTRYNVEIDFDRYIELCDQFKRGDVEGLVTNHIGDKEGWVELSPDVWACAYWHAKDETIGTFFAPPPPRVEESWKREVEQKLRAELTEKLTAKLTREIQTRVGAKVNQEARAKAAKQAKIDAELAVKYRVSERNTELEEKVKALGQEIERFKALYTQEKQKLSWFKAKLMGVKWKDLTKRAKALQSLPRSFTPEEGDAWVAEQERRHDEYWAAATLQNLPGVVER